jgi:hypothetical protein
MMTLMVAMTAIMEFGHPTPHIGDIVSFIASSGQTVDGGVLLTVPILLRIGHEYTSKLRWKCRRRKGDRSCAGKLQRALGRCAHCRG